MAHHRQLEALLHGVIARKLKLREVVNGSVRWEKATHGS
jgi:hypothetical protein